MKAARYTLKINGATAGSFDVAQLGRGINLAELPTPMAAQAASVHELTLKRAGVHQTRWRQIEMPLREDSLPRVGSILENLDALDADLEARRRSRRRATTSWWRSRWPANERE